MKIQSACILIILLVQHSVSWAEDAINKDPLYITGNKTHQNHCYKCHTDQIYTRDNHFVDSISALGSQVKRCKDSSDIPWFEEDTGAVIHFLNKKYYKF
jgi:hypothetical protein